MSSAKCLITGMPNSGKTTLLGTLKNVLVVSRDGKPFSLPLSHYNVPNYDSIDDFTDLLDEKLEAYNDKFGMYPRTLAFDSVSRIMTDIETFSYKKFKGFDVWNNVNKEINKFLSTLALLQDQGMNLVLVAHVVWDENARKYIETSKGSFGKIGGFLSTVDYAINVDLVGNKHIVTLKGTNLSRTLISDVPDKLDASKFNLQEYLEKIGDQASEVEEKWSI